jgi:hypothetical protein
MIDIITKWNNQKEKAVENRKIIMVKNSDGDIVFFKNQYDVDTGELLLQRVIINFTVKDINKKIDEYQEIIALLKAFKSEVS